MSKEQLKDKENDISSILQKLPPSFLLHLINKAKHHLKSDSTMQQVFQDYSADPDSIDLIPVTFGDFIAAYQNAVSRQTCPRKRPRQEG